MRLLPQSTPIRPHATTIMQQSPTLLIRQVLPEPQVLAEQPAAGLPCLDVHKDRQGGADDAPRHGEGEVDGHGVVAQGPVGERVQGGLDELAQARDGGDAAVDTAEGCEAEDFGGVVPVRMSVMMCLTMALCSGRSGGWDSRDCGVVERSEYHECNDGGVACP